VGSNPGGGGEVRTSMQFAFLCRYRLRERPIAVPRSPNKCLRRNVINPENERPESHRFLAPLIYMYITSNTNAQDLLHHVHEQPAQ